MIERIITIGKRLVYKHCSQEAVDFLRKQYFFFRIKSNGIFIDEKDLRLVSKIIQPDDIVVDIGANVGVYTVFISRLLSERGFVLSFEPIPATYKILENNINKFCGVKAKPFNLALSDRKGSIEMVVPKDNGGVYNFYLGHIRPDRIILHNEHSFNVKTATLDDILQNSGHRVDFVKCDVEGAELLVLQGAEKSIRKYLPNIMCEISGGHQRYGYTAADVFNYLWNQGYLSYVPQNEKLIVCSGFRKGYPNYFFLHPLRAKSIFATLSSV
jgi:FkbM family methyltransferase